MEQCVSFEPSEKAVSLCGFDAPVAEIQIDYRTPIQVQQVLNVTVGVKSETLDGYYVRINEDTTIYLMSTQALTQLLNVAQNGFAS